MSMVVEERNNNPHTSYSIVFGSEPHGKICSMIQSANIALGNQLEKYLKINCPIKEIEWKKRFSVKGQKKRIEPDFFYDDGEIIHIGEIKLGSTFDTKKSSSEILNLYKLKNRFESEGRKVELYFLSYLAVDLDMMRVGLKGCLTSDINLMIGRDFFEWFNVDYESFEEELKDTQKKNRIFVNNYFIENLIGIS